MSAPRQDKGIRSKAHVPLLSLSLSESCFVLFRGRSNYLSMQKQVSKIELIQILLFRTLCSRSPSWTCSKVDGGSNLVHRDYEATARIIESKREWVWENVTSSCHLWRIAEHRWILSWSLSEKDYMDSVHLMQSTVLWCRRWRPGCGDAASLRLQELAQDWKHVSLLIC